MINWNRRFCHVPTFCIIKTSHQVACFWRFTYFYKKLLFVIFRQPYPYGTFGFCFVSQLNQRGVVGRKTEGPPGLWRVGWQAGPRGIKNLLSALGSGVAALCLLWFLKVSFRFPWVLKFYLKLENPIFNFGGNFIRLVLVLLGNKGTVINH